MKPWFQCSQSSRDWWNAVRVAVAVGVIVFQCSQSSRDWWNAVRVAVAVGVIVFQCSQSSRGWWNAVFETPSNWGRHCFSALSRAVVGGTPLIPTSSRKTVRFSALSRAVVGGTLQAHADEIKRAMFQCSQSSRGWWNYEPPVPDNWLFEVSVLSVEPWLVELINITPAPPL